VLGTTVIRSGTAQLWQKTSAPDTGWTQLATGSGSGDVVGPSSAASGNVAAFDGVTGKLLKDGVVLGTAATADVYIYGDILP
jgi:hypothetical protein